MRALILNSGMGKRMGELAHRQPKCLSLISEKETILGRQLTLLHDFGIAHVVMTVGPFREELVEYCESLQLDLTYTFVFNPIYSETNYIYSIYLARKHLSDDIVMMHGDLVFERSVLADLLEYEKSCAAISSIAPLPIKDFKAVVRDGVIKAIGVEFFEDAFASQPLYKISRSNWEVWLKRIIDYCESGYMQCYAENAFNEISDQCLIYPLDIGARLCAEIDTPEDLELVRHRLNLLQLKKEA